MLTLLGFGLLAIVVAGALFLLAAYFLPPGEQIAPAIRDEPLWDLPPERPLVAGDIEGVRLPVALRGYRFAETDLLLDRLADELRTRDAEIARLRARSGTVAPSAREDAEVWATAADEGFDAETDTDTDTGVTNDTNTDADTDTDADANTDTDAEADAEPDADRPADSDRPVETGPRHRLRSPTESAHRAGSESARHDQ